MLYINIYYLIYGFIYYLYIISHDILYIILYITPNNKHVAPCNTLESSPDCDKKLSSISWFQLRRIRASVNSVMQIPLNTNMRVTPGGDNNIGISRTTNKVIKVSSNKNIVVYGINKKQFSTDGFLALPVASIGQWFLLILFAWKSNINALLGTYMWLNDQLFSMLLNRLMRP